MSWNYDLFNCLRYEYPNESPGPERPSDPPIPPAGWPLPRVGEVLPVDQNDDRFTPFKARVIGVEWDYAVPRVTVQLEVVREPTLNTIQFAPQSEQRFPTAEDLEKIHRALGQLNYVKPSKGDM